MIYFEFGKDCSLCYIRNSVGLYNTLVKCSSFNLLEVVERNNFCDIEYYLELLEED